MTFDEESRPQVFGFANFAKAVLLHLAVFLFFYGFAKLHFRPKEAVIPIDLTVVVNDNLDGDENEPPPLRQPDPPPPPTPRPEPKPVEPPKADEHVRAVEEIREKPSPKPPEKKPEPKPPEKKPEPKPPEKTPEELRRERELARKKRMEEMVSRATKVKTPITVRDQPSGNGRTARQTLSQKDILDKFNQGYRPGRTEQLAANELQRCISLIQMALDRQWEALSPTVDRSGVVYLTVQFSNAGRMQNCRISQSCGSAASDRAALNVANSVGVIVGLGPEFIAQSQKQPVTIRYTIRGQ